MTTLDARVSCCDSDQFEWEVRHPILKALAHPSLLNVFVGSAGILLTIDEVDRALDAIDDELENEHTTSKSKGELLLLKKAVALRGRALAIPAVSILTFHVGVGKESAKAFEEHWAPQCLKRYNALLNGTTSPVRA